MIEHWYECLMAECRAPEFFKENGCVSCPYIKLRKTDISVPAWFYTISTNVTCCTADAVLVPFKRTRFERLKDVFARYVNGSTHLDEAEAVG